MSQAYQARKLREYGGIKHTPVAAVDAGAVTESGAYDSVLSPAHIGMFCGAPGSPIAAGTLGDLQIGGVYDVVLAYNSGNSGNALVIAAGAAVYWDRDGNPKGGTDGSGAATSTSTAPNRFLGYAVAASVAADTTVKVQFFPVPIVTYSAETALSCRLVDPGDAGTIPVTASGYIPLVTAAAETRTLPAPTFAGQELLLFLKHDGGNCTINCATGLNATGNTRAVLDTAGDLLLLEGVYGADTPTYFWRIVSSDGASLSTP